MTGKSFQRICPCGKDFETNYSKKIFCNRRCISEKNHNSFAWNEKQRNYKYKINYGITLDDYNAMFEDQEGCCAICKTHQSELKKALNVDHNHSTGQIRGLLCHSCNLAIGRLKEDPVIIAAALEYVKLPEKS